MFRVATKNDKENLCELWQQGFNEGQKEASFVFESFADYKNIYIKEENNSPIAMLISVDVEMSGKKGAYFYGLTTLPQYQKNGVMSKLIDEVCDELKTLGYTFAVLIPQDKTLFDFYEKRDFKTQFYLRHFSHTVKSNVFVKADFDTVTAKSLRGLRRKFIKGQRVELNEKSEIATVLDMYSEGGFTVETKSGYGIFYKQKDVMLFEELFADSEYDAEQILQAAKQYCGCSVAKGFVAYGNDIFLGEGELLPFGMLRFFGEEFRLDLPYMNMMLN